MVVFFTDCMSIGPVEYGSEHLYPYLVMKDQNEEYQVIGMSGAVTNDSLDVLKKVKSLKPRIVIYGFGVNDALPRGLKRSTRGKIIRTMYKLRFNEKARLFLRKYFLNPLEFICGVFVRNQHYISIDQMKENLDFIAKEIVSIGSECIFINIAPVKNYRFINATKHIEEYNRVIDQVAFENTIKVVDVYNCFRKKNIKEVLAGDKFHYGREGHRLVAGELIKVMQSVE